MPLPMAVCLFTKPEDFYYELDRRGMTGERPPFVPDGATACVHRFDGNDGTEVNVICFDMKKCKGKPAHVMLGMLAHEVTHVKQHCMEYIGEHSPSKEFEAYSMQHIFEEAAKELLRQMKC